MKYDDFKEQVSHGTPSFPVAAYAFDGNYKYTVNDHWHEETELIYLKEGHFEISLREQEQAIEAPALLFIPRGFLHGISLKYHQKEEALVFDGNILVEPLLNRIKCEAVIITDKDKEFDALKGLFEKAHREASRGADRSMLKLRLYLTEFVGELMETGLVGINKEKASERSGDVITEIKDYISEHYEGQIRIGDIAGALKLNEQYICRIFKKNTGKTITEYINEVRINAAERLLQETDDKVIDIAMATGYDNISYFIKRFKIVKGITPNEYRVLR